MTAASDLLKLPGAIAAGQFSRKGQVDEFAGSLAENEVVLLAGLCSAIALTMEMQGKLLDRLTGKSGWRDCYGWATWGPEAGIVSVGESFCVMQTGPASFNAVFQALRVAEGIGKAGNK